MPIRPIKGASIFDELLETKLEVPSLRSHIVQRDRLTELLDNSINRQLCLITAPAGYGKTTLLGEWLSRLLPSNRRVAWVTLDQYDNSPLRFWLYLGSALQKIHPPLGGDLQRSLQCGYDLHQFTWLNPFINALAGVPFEVILILDDYQVITDEITNRSLAYLIDHQPKNLHLIISSRVNPGLHLARLRGQGQLLELNALDLAFTLQEEKTLLANVMGVEMETEQMAELLHATQGWIAGLRLAAISVQGRFDVNTMITSLPGGNPQIFDYLIEEVLTQQTPEIQDFLLKTSILDEFSSSLCDLLLGHTDSQGMINQLEALNLFITPLDEKRRWYRYHPLFAEALRNQLAKRVSVEEIRLIHQKAYPWLLKNGFPERSVTHALAAGDPGNAARILEGCTMKAVTNFDLPRLTQWIRSIPNELILERPHLGIYFTIANTILGRYELVEPMLCLVEEALQKAMNRGMPFEDDDVIRWEAAGNRAMLACIQGDLEGGVPLMARLLAEAPHENYLYGSMNYRLGESYHSLGNLTAACRYFTEGGRIASQNNECFNQFHVMLGLANVWKIQGNLDKAQAEYQGALQLVQQKDLGMEAGAFARMGLVELDLERLERIDLNQRFVQCIVDHFEQIILGSLVWENRVLLLLRLAKQFLACNDVVGAERYFIAAVQHYHKYHQVSYHIALELLDQQVLIWKAKGKPEGIERQQRELIAELRLNNRLNGGEPLSMARIFLAKGEPQKAILLLEPVRKSFREAGMGYWWIRAEIVEALAQYELGREQLAFQSIETALKFSAGQNIRQPFMTEGNVMRELILAYDDSRREIRQNSNQTEWNLFGDSLLQDFESVQAYQGTSQDPVMTTYLAPILEPLSDRELTIVKFLVAGKSNKEIAAELMISINTTKDHVKNIFRKMGVHTRKALAEKLSEKDIVIPSVSDIPHKGQTK